MCATFPPVAPPRTGRDFSVHVQLLTVKKFCMSRKFRRAKHQARQTAPPPKLDAAQASLARRAADRDRNITLCFNPPGVEKMSEVLLQFADPILDRSAPIEEIRTTLFFAMIIWNYSLLSAEARSESEDPLREVMSHPWSRSVAQRLLERKAQLFANNRRMLCDLEIFQKEDQLTVNVVSLDTAPQTAGDAK